MENSIENIRRSKQTISEIVITTVIISIGINFVVLGISKELDFNNNFVSDFMSCHQIAHIS